MNPDWGGGGCIRPTPNQMHAGIILLGDKRSLSQVAISLWDCLYESIVMKMESFIDVSN